MTDDNDRGVDAYEIPEAAQPPKKKGLRWWHIVVPLFVLLFGVCGFIALQAKGEYDSARGVIEDYFAAVRADDYVGAARLRCDSNTEAEAAAVRDFESAVDGQIDGVSLPTWNIETSAGSNPEAQFQGSLRAGRRRLPVQILLEKMSGDWKICAINVDTDSVTTTTTELG